MKTNNKNDEMGAPLVETRPAHPVKADSLLNQQQNNHTPVNNPYASWSFDQLYSECKRRGLL